MEHQERALRAYLEGLDADTLGVVLVGSLARGTERDDSDVDVYRVVSDAQFAQAEHDNRLAWVERRDQDYPAGYIDVKLASPSYLARAATDGDDPTRASFAGARVALDRTGTLAEVVVGIGERPEPEWLAMMESFHAQTRLHGLYFLPHACAVGDDFLRAHAGLHTALAAARMALAGNRVFFRGQKYVTTMLPQLPDLPEGFLTGWRTLVADPTPEHATSVIEGLQAWRPQPLDHVLSTFIRDNELAWLRGTVPTEYR